MKTENMAVDMLRGLHPTDFKDQRIRRMFATTSVSSHALRLCQNISIPDVDREILTVYQGACAGIPPQERATA